MNFEDCRYDARKSRELVNMKILVSLDKFCLSYSDGFYSVSQSATYQQISTGTSCYNFSLKKRSVHVVTAMFRFSFETSSDILGVTLAPRRKQQRLIISYIDVLILRV